MNPISVSGPQEPTTLAAAPDRNSLTERLRRHDRLLGAVLSTEAIPRGLAAALDLVLLTGAPSTATLAMLSALSVPLVPLVDSESEAVAAREAGAPAVATRGAPTSWSDLALGGNGTHVVVTATAARAAFASGADLVVYDLPAMIDELFQSLRDVRSATSSAVPREPVVLLSGMLGDDRLWEGVAGGLADISIPWPIRIDLDDSISEMAASVLAAAPARFALAGHSLGGIVALEIMRRAPERVSRIALLNTTARGPSDGQLETWASWRNRADAGEFEQLAEELAHATLGGALPSPELLAVNRQMARAVGPDGFRRQLAAQAGRPDSTTNMPTIAVPVLIVSGEADGTCPQELQRELAALCPQSQWESVPGGHMSPLEAPGPVSDLLRTWLGTPARESTGHA